MMLNQTQLKARLPIEGWGAQFEFHTSLPSTNDRAKNLAEAGALHGTLIVADEQTAGRGRGRRRWYTPPGSALAMSLVLRPNEALWAYLNGLSALGALAVVEALSALQLEALIKWPNDVLLSYRKVSGILVETSWRGDQLDYAVVGIGLNVRPKSVPESAHLQWPATCVEAEAGVQVDRLDLLLGILERLAAWYPQLGDQALVNACEARLAYRGQEVRLQSDQRVLEGRLSGLDPVGRLLVATSEGVEKLNSGSWQFERVDRAEK